MIPKCFHRVWLRSGPDDVIPDRFEAYWDRFRDLHPGWEFRTWSSTAEVRAMLYPANRAVFDWQTTDAGRSDVARYAILAAHGGVYVDTDVEPLRSFEPLRVHGDYPFAGWEDDRSICPTVMGSPPGHPAIVDLVDRLAWWAGRRRRLPPNVQTGPTFLTRRWRHRPDVMLYAPVRFYPVGWWERDRLGGPYPDGSFAVHHWSQSWDPVAKARIDARQPTRTSG